MTDWSSDYLADRAADPELESDVARFRSIGRKSGERGFLATLKSQTDVAQAAAQSPGPIGEFITNLPRNISVGVIDAAINTLTFAEDLSRNMAQGDAARERRDGTDTATTPTDDELKQAKLPPEIGEGLHLLRGELASTDDGLGDEITQSAAQFFVPFAAWSKAAGGFGFVKSAAADAATMSTSFDPHEARFADLLRLTDTDNRLVNAYIDVLGSDDEEGDWEGRWKNVVDSLAVTAAVGGVIKIGGAAIRKVRSGTRPKPAKEAEK
jgi:hypothetical protein